MVPYRCTALFVTYASCLGILSSATTATYSHHNPYLSLLPLALAQNYGEKLEKSIEFTNEAAGLITLKRLQATPPTPNPSIIQTPLSAAKKIDLLNSKKGWLILGLGGIGFIVLVGGLFYLFLPNNEEPDQNLSEKLEPHSEPVKSTETQPKIANQPENIGENFANNGYYETSINLAPKYESKSLKTSSENFNQIEQIEQLINLLKTSDALKRRQVIWELGQRGDSRAIQPLVNLMIDSDSIQRSLILAALAEIGTRTLQMLNRVFANALHDDNAEVRKNAIRDLTRLYDLLNQMSPLLRHAADDPNLEVQQTARWAITQINHIRGLPLQDYQSNLTEPAPNKNLSENDEN